MKRLFLLIGPSGLDRRPDIHLALSQRSYRMVATDYYADTPAALVDGYLDALIGLGRLRESLRDDITEIHREGPVEAAVWESAGPRNGVPRETLASLGITHDLCQTSVGLLAESDTAVKVLGGLFFWKKLYDRTKFTTNNESLFKGDYLPVLLARHGTGVFFEERLVDSLLNLGLLKSDDKVRLIEDLGGWQDRESLIARVKVHIRRGGQPVTETLIAEAMAPYPPVKPGDLVDAIRQRTAFLCLLDIQTSVLAADEGVVYRRSIPFSLRQYLRHRESGKMARIVKQAARIAAIVDAGCLRAASIDIASLNGESVSDYLEIGLDAPLTQKISPSLLDALRTDGQEVFWTNLCRDLAAFGEAKGRVSLHELLQACDQSFHKLIRETYLRTSQRCAGDAWLSRKLSGH